MRKEQLTEAEARARLRDALQGRFRQAETVALPILLQPPDANFTGRDETSGIYADYCNSKRWFVPDDRDSVPAPFGRYLVRYVRNYKYPGIAKMRMVVELETGQITNIDVKQIAPHTNSFWARWGTFCLRWECGFGDYLQVAVREQPESGHQSLLTAEKIPDDRIAEIGTWGERSAVRLETFTLERCAAAVAGGARQCKHDAILDRSMCKLHDRKSSEGMAVPRFEEPTQQ